MSIFLDDLLGWQKWTISVILVSSLAFVLPWVLTQSLFPTADYVLWRLITPAIFGIAIIIITTFTQKPNEKRLVRLKLWSRLWHPPTLVRFLLRLQAIFPQSRLALFHTKDISWTVFGHPKHATPLPPSLEWNPTANLLHLTLDATNIVEIWASPNLEGMRLSHLPSDNHASTSVPIWDPTHPSYLRF